MKQISSFLIAGPKSNSGKTILTLGILRALVRKGLSVQPFKVGPDYIDPMHHTNVAGRSSYNLDAWMSSKEHVETIYNTHSAKADVSIVEGVMGLFDGAKKDKGSSADIAKQLNLPVVLVVDAASTAYSIAPLLYGFKHFDPKVNIAGVIFNKVGSASHYSFLKDAADDVGVASLGYIPKSKGLDMPSRHLGLMMPQDKETQSPIDVAADLVEEYLDLDLLLEQCKREIPVVQKGKVPHQNTTNSRPIFAVANDEAFNFMYPANIDVLEEMGEVTYFSPLHDSKLPTADVVWLPGGYPELFAKQLSENTSMIHSIQNFVDTWGKLIAECGGMMYLGEALINKEGEHLSMCELFNYKASTQEMKLTLGYRTLTSEKVELKGHEFHYSKLISEDTGATQYTAITARGKEVNMPVFRKDNVWSSYLHLYLGEKEKMESFLGELK